MHCFPLVESGESLLQTKHFTSPRLQSLLYSQVFMVTKRNLTSSMALLRWQSLASNNLDIVRHHTSNWMQPDWNNRSCLLVYTLVRMFRTTRWKTKSCWVVVVEQILLHNTPVDIKTKQAGNSKREWFLQDSIGLERDTKYQKEVLPMWCWCLFAQWRCSTPPSLKI